MNLLLDTQIYLWFLADSRKLSKKAKSRIEATDGVFVSAASIWEVAIKIGIGKLSARCDDVIAGIDASGFVELPVLSRHGALVSTMPHHHRDPFDRLLLAQAMAEPMRLMTADAALRRYSELVELV